MGDNDFHSRQEEQREASSTQALRRASSLLQQVSDLGNGDEADLLQLVYRNDLEALERQISDIESQIKLDQEHVRAAAAALEEFYRTRSLLLTMRAAIGQFVRRLEHRNSDLSNPDPVS